MIAQVYAAIADLPLNTNGRIKGLLDPNRSQSDVARIPAAPMKSGANVSPLAQGYCTPPQATAKRKVVMLAMNKMPPSQSKVVLP
jgi:hypothetical protein